MNKQEIINAFNFRHACKEFDSTKKISESDFNCILESARLSPSSFGFEPWHFIIVQNQELRTEFLETFWGGQRQIPTSSHLIFTLVKKPFFMRYDSDYVKNFMENIQELPAEIVKMKGNFYKKFQEIDFDLTSSQRAMTDWATHQTYIALGNMMTVAAMLGIDSCPMEGFDKNTVNKTLAEKLNIDIEKYSIAYAVAFGYRKEQPRPKTRQKIEDITTWVL